MSGKGEKLGTMVLDTEEIIKALSDYVLKRFNASTGVYSTDTRLTCKNGVYEATVTAFTDA